MAQSGGLSAGTAPSGDLLAERSAALLARLMRPRSPPPSTSAAAATTNIATTASTAAAGHVTRLDAASASNSASTTALAAAAPSASFAATGAEAKVASAAEHSSAPAQATSVTRSAAAAGASNATAHGRSNLLSRLPDHHKTHLRYGYHVPTGEFVPYYLGVLKSFNHRQGYGFIECPEAHSLWSCDVFIHKKLVPHPFHIGQFVEFAVTVSLQGRPQACDVVWLPQLPASVVRPAMGTGASPATGSTLSGGSGSTASAGALRLPADRPSDARRHLGTLKSYSLVQGYGFISCDEIFSMHKHDTYFDKSQMPSKSWRFGHTIEFSMHLNAKNQPQAREINWNPVPLLPLGLLATQADADALNEQKHRTQHSKNVHEHLKELHKLLHTGQHETAIATAIHFQGGGSSGNVDQVVIGGACVADSYVDYVAFVLDRLPFRVETVTSLDHVVKMLLLVMLAKMFSTQVTESRCQQLLRWFDEVSKQINVSCSKVRTLCAEAFLQIEANLRVATQRSPHLAGGNEAGAMLTSAFQSLRQKATSTTNIPSSVDAPPNDAVSGAATPQPNAPNADAAGGSFREHAPADALEFVPTPGDSGSTPRAV